MTLIATEDTYKDIIIVGAGIAGKSLAAILRNSGVNFALIAPENVAGQQIQSSDDIDPRVLALTLASKNIFESIGIWSEITKDGLPGYFNKIHVWDEQGHIDFNSADLHEPVMGYIVSQKTIERKLHALLENLRDHICCQSAVTTLLENKENQISIELKNGHRLSAKLLVAADGQSSTIRRLANINYKTHDYNQYALTCVVETGLPHQHVARQRFLRSGPLAFLPMAKENQCSVIWSTTPEHAKELKTLDEKAFHKILAEMFDYRVGGIIRSGQRVVFPLLCIQADQYCRPRIALVGDAAHRIHPMSGQGANLALLDIACLAELILQARSRNKDIGSKTVLRKYERWRKAENSTMILGIDICKYFFENKMTIFDWLRNIGMNTFDSMHPVKHEIMRRAMGLRGDLPDIATKHY